MTHHNRILWILSRTNCVAETNNVKLFRTYDSLINKYTELKAKHNFWVIGGKQIYELFENIVDCAYHCQVQELLLPNNSSIHNLITYKLPHFFKLDDCSDLIHILKNILITSNQLIIFMVFIPNINI